ncbi:MAG TPA: hypothetical protein VFQ61_32410 [Polyangiaceae bacterium]|nr:hypothetical protein [Polyangiaceae bacterium]
MRARGRNLRAGVLFAGLALGTILLGGERHLAGPLRWLIAIPLGLASYALLVGAFGVCASSGLRGMRFEDYGREAILDRASRRRLRLRALIVLSLSAFIAGLFAFAFANRS